MIAAVVDTNVLASGFVRSNPQAAPTLLVEAWRAGRFTLIISEHILTELLRTFTTPYFAGRLSRELVAQVELLRSDGIITPLNATVTGVATPRRPHGAGDGAQWRGGTSGHRRCATAAPWQLPGGAHQ